MTPQPFRHSPFVFRIPFVIRHLSFVILLLLLSAQSQSLVFERTVVDLKPVATWDDLLKTPVVTIGNSEIHLGIEATTCPAYTGILVYCHVAKGPEFPAGGFRKIGEILGPVQVQVIHLDGPKRAQEISEVALDHQDREVGDVFFATHVHVPREGKYELRVFSFEGELLARTTVTATKPVPASWFILKTGIAQKNDPAVAQVTGESGTPKWDGSAPIRKTDKLPRFLGDNLDSNLEAAINDRLVTIKSNDYIDDEIDKHWLIRLWVNGKPFEISGEAPKALHLEKSLLDVAKGMPKLPMKLSFRLDIDRKTLDLKPDDKIEFQLLYAAHEIDELRELDQLEKVVKSLSDASPICLTKKLPYPN